MTRSVLPLLVLVLVEGVIGQVGEEQAFRQAVPAAAPEAVPSKKVLVQVMYESLCPDSIRFVKDQLTPTYETLGPQRMVVEFVPYGKATTYPTDTGYSFRCQHGPSECRGNKLQACALARLLGDNKKQVKFVNCIMKLSNPSRPSEKCIVDAGLDAGELKECVAGREGQVLLAGMGEKTPSDIDFVPTVNFNGEFKQGDQDQALYNLLYVACDKLAPNDRPTACERKKGTGWFFWG